MENNGLTPIREKFLNRSDLFGLEFKEGFIFLEVEDWEELSYKPYSNIGSVSSQDNSEYTRLNDPNENDDILFIESGQIKVLHVGIGMRPFNIRRFTRYPENGPNLRSIPNLNQPSSRSGNDFGGVTGTDSPYDNPTDAEELLIPPDVHVNFDFYNPDPNESREPILNILMRVYKIRPLDPSSSADLNAIRNIVRPGSAPPIYPVGTLNTKVNYNLKSDWDGVSPLSSSRVDSLRRNQ